MKFLLFSLYLASILTSLVIALVYRKSIKGRGLIILLPYLLFVCLQEIVLFIYLLKNPDASTALVYNIYKPISVLVFFWLYYQVELMRPVRRILLWLTIGYLAFTVYTYLRLEKLTDTSSYLALARGFVITIFGILCLLRFFNLDNQSEEAYWRPLIWITVGVVVYYPVTSISINFQAYLSAYNLKIYNLKLYQVIPQLMSIFMYSCFSYAFYLCRRKN